METIYPPAQYGSSKRMNLIEYFANLKQLVKEFSTTTTFKPDNVIEDMLSFLEADITHEEVNDILETIRVDDEECTSSAENPLYPIDCPKTIKSTTKLPEDIIDPTYKTDLSIVHFREINSQKEGCTFNRLRTSHINISHIAIEKPLSAPDLEPNGDFVISVLIYRPVFLNYFSASNRSDNLRLRQEVLMLGNNSLDQLRDVIKCTSDEVICKEVESTSDQPTQSAKEKYPSGFFFIDNVFYNDFRNPDSIDYSEPLVKWCKEQKIKDIRSTVMTNVKISDLIVRFNYPYLYMHQGNCEHLITFADARLLHKDDYLHSSLYPLVAAIYGKPSINCSICTSYIAQWICIDNERLPQQKVFLCTNCCNSYNYIDGKKIGNFKLFPYKEF